MVGKVTLLAGLTGLVALGCGGKQAAAPVDCNGEQRVQLDCESEISYQGTRQEAGLNFLKVGASGEQEEKAIRKVSAEVEAYMAQHARICRAYNGCTMSAQEYNERSDALQQQLSQLLDKAAAVEAMQVASNATEEEKHQYVQGVAQLYRMLPEDKRGEAVTVLMDVEAQLPESLGSRRWILQSGDRLPTGASLTINMQVSADAHAYIFQKAPSGEINVLFPNEAISLQNPLRGGVPVRIPPGSQSFRVNDEDIGAERFVVAVSRKPIAQLEDALRRVDKGEPAQKMRSLEAVAAVGEGGGPENCRALEIDDSGDPAVCRRERGLEVSSGENSFRSVHVADSPGSPSSSLAAETEPGDDMIVRSFFFEHLTLKDYKAQSAR